MTFGAFLTRFVHWRHLAEPLTCEQVVEDIPRSALAIVVPEHAARFACRVEVIAEKNTIRGFKCLHTVAPTILDYIAPLVNGRSRPSKRLQFDRAMVALWIRRTPRHSMVFSRKERSENLRARSST